MGGEYLVWEWKENFRGFRVIDQAVKKWGLKNIKTKNILADWWRKLKCQEKFFRISVDWRWPCNSTKQLCWFFTKEIIALTNSPTFSSRLIFYSRPTVIYVLVFLPSAVLFYQKTFISFHEQTFIKKHFINNFGFPVFI